MANIHPTAIIEDGATIADDATIGPYCTIGAQVTLASGVTLVSHVSVAGQTTIGENTTIYPFASIGHPPQDLKFSGEKSTLTIGKNNQIREHVTINPGTEGGGLNTTVGDNCLFMVASHIAHDCRVGNHVILANNATLAGHVVVEDFAIIGGLAAIHQFVRIGKHAMIGGMSGVEKDVIPFGSVKGERAHLAGLNVIGLKRRDFSRDDIHALRKAYRELFAAEGTMDERLADAEDLFKDSDAVMNVINFIKQDSSRSFCQPKS